jgi:hypothetical protein
MCGVRLVEQIKTHFRNIAQCQDKLIEIKLDAEERC